MATLKYQGAVAPGSLITKTGQAVLNERDRFTRIVQPNWGADGTTYLVRDHRVWRAACIDAHSEASDVWVIPRGFVDENKAILVSNRVPFLGPIEGPLLLAVKDGQPAGDTLLHTLKLNLYPFEPTWLPDKRAPARYYYYNGSFGGQDPVTIFEEWFRGREGFSMALKNNAGGDAIDWVVYAGHWHEDRGSIYDVLDTGTIIAGDEVLYHWEGRADAMKLTFDADGGTADVEATFYFRDEF